MEKPELDADLESKVHRGAKQERSSLVKSILNKSSQNANTDFQSYITSL